MIFSRRRGEVEALKQTIALLVEERDWLRMMLGTPTPRASLLPKREDDIERAAPITMETLFRTEDEEDVQAMLDAGHISKEDIPEVLEALGYANTEVTFAT